MHKLPIQVAAGSIPGRDHISRGGVLIGRRNQDAFAIAEREGVLVAVVSDGCGSSENSEIGSTTCSELFATELAKGIGALIRDGESVEDPIAVRAEIHRVLDRAEGVVCKYIANSATALMDHSFSRTVSRYFLFTLVGVIVTPYRAHTFSLGDGVISVNNELQVLGPFPSNAPPYIAYRIVGSTLFEEDSPLLRSKIHHSVPLEELDSILIGTDGVEHLSNAAERFVPGKSEKVGPLSQFWLEDRYFKNPDAIRRRLAVLNNEDNRVNPQTGLLVRTPGLLPDDTTLVAIRRIPREEN